MKKNIYIIGLLFLVLFVIIAVKAYFLQILTSQELSKKIRSQHKRRISLAPTRGTIYDRNGAEMAMSIDVESLFVRPHQVDTPGSVARQLAPIIGMSRATITRKLKSRKSFVWLKRKVTPSQAEKIRALSLNGLDFVKETQRFYPNKELAGQLIGFAGIDAQGLEGLERAYDDVLRGTGREIEADRDALGRYLVLEGLDKTSDVQGHNLVLTIDKNIQYIAEKELAAAVSLSKAKSGISIVMDPWSGEVLAMAMAPRFNPNRFSESRPEIWRNRAVTDVYEPGSTFKAFLVASALEERLIKPRDIFFCENGSFRVANNTIHDVHKYGWLSVTKILKYSSNIGASKIGKSLGNESFYRYIRKFGFGEETGIQVPIEASGFVPLPYRLSVHTQSAITFGQGISVTPLQLAAAYSAIANGGRLLRPSLVKRITDHKGTVIQERRPYVRRTVISAETAAIVTRMLKGVITDDGTGIKAAVSGFSVAGKTGTSQKLEKSSGRYSHKKSIASFAGFIPADSRPRLTILVIIDEPQRMSYGGEIAAPVFSRIAQLVLNYIQVTPDSLPQQAPAVRLKRILASRSPVVTDET
ncbi:MAG: penicillin-binding protein 2 [Deltaproteobacteria bacterium]|nr:penicillin-binding protein 2 [Deltaproteobacteria bacterium]